MNEYKAAQPIYYDNFFLNPILLVIWVECNGSLIVFFFAFYIRVFFKALVFCNNVYHRCVYAMTLHTGTKVLWTYSDHHLPFFVEICIANLT